MNQISGISHERLRPLSHAPYLGGSWDGHRVTAAFTLALLPPLGIALFEQGVARLQDIAMAMVVVLAWQALFARMRGRSLGWDGIVPALAFALMLSTSTPLWQQALALTFGIVMGEQIFGGRGRNFLNPVVLALAFLLFSFPSANPEPAGLALAIASLPGALLLLATGLISWRVLVGVAIGLVFAATLTGSENAWDQTVTGTLIFGIVFLACDPVAAASTNLGRWLYGLLTGTLVILIGSAGSGSGSAHAVVFAALLASIFAPLIDHGVIWLNIRRRRRRHA